MAAKFLAGSINNHFEFMQTKHKMTIKIDSVLCLSGPEWKSAHFDGKLPEKTGRVIVSVVEIYETEDGLHHHWIESKNIIRFS